jgi:hypothetical protein
LYPLLDENHLPFMLDQYVFFHLIVLGKDITEGRSIASFQMSNVCSAISACLGPFLHLPLSLSPMLLFSMTCRSCTCCLELIKPAIVFRARGNPLHFLTICLPSGGDTARRPWAVARAPWLLGSSDGKINKGLTCSVASCTWAKDNWAFVCQWFNVTA